MTVGTSVLKIALCPEPGAAKAPERTSFGKALGRVEIASLEPGQALERLVTRTRRYARYQRKRMQRIPGIVLLDGARDAGTVADEVVARARRPPVAHGGIV